MRNYSNFIIITIVIFIIFYVFVNITNLKVLNLFNSKILCEPRTTLTLLEKNKGRLDSDYPSPRCCVDSGCLKSDKGRYAVLTTLRTDNYFVYLVNLYCSLKKSNPNVKLVVATVRGDLSVHVELAVRMLGDNVSLIYWEEFIIPNKLHKRFELNWVKIRAWELIQYDAILMVDSDVVILDDISNLFRLPVHFACVLDEDKTLPRYNSLGSLQGGVILLRPCKQITDHMIAILTSSTVLHFDEYHAEQDFLDWYFRYDRWTLPTKYNSIMHLLDENGLTSGGINPVIVHNTRKSKHVYSFTVNDIPKLAQCEGKIFYSY